MSATLKEPNSLEFVEMPSKERGFTFFVENIKSSFQALSKDQKYLTKYVDE
jgi:hypothetical protein